MCSFDEQLSLATANVQNNEELLLVLNTNNAAARLNFHTKDKSTLAPIHFDSESDSDDNEETNNTYTQMEINTATAHLEPKNMCGPNVVNIDELVLQSDVQYDIRKILISLAMNHAYVIGSGPYATRIINMLKQKLIQRKQHEQDTQQCLIEMGFSRTKVQHALNIKK